MRPLLFWAAENQGVLRHVLYERKRPRSIIGIRFKRIEVSARPVVEYAIPEYLS
jgi:hypothetical protein